MFQQKEHFGVGSIVKLKDILSQNEAKNIFLIRGKKSYEVSGIKKIIEALLKEYNVTEFYNFEPNPKIEDIVRGIDEFKKSDIDFVIGVGGGSVIDMAKAISALGVQSDEPEKYIKNKKEIKNRGKKLIAIPTTAGTGSEATHFAVVYINKTKYSLKHKYLLPNYAIIDPQFTFSLPKRITASTGMDALSQAIESYWCINSNKESKKYAEEAIKLIMKNLPLAVNKSEQSARVEMSKAANLAGKAINITQTTACHAISYPITSYFNIPHGHAVSLTLGSMLVYNSNVSVKDVLDKRGINYIKETMDSLIKIIGATDEYMAKEIINNLMREISLEIRLDELNINKNDIELIIKNGFNPDRVKNNPRLLTKENLRKILNDLR